MGPLLLRIGLFLVIHASLLVGILALRQLP
jgi:hypothetical protein